MIRFGQVGVRNQQNLYPRIPTTDVAKLRSIVALGSNTGMSFFRERRVTVHWKWYFLVGVLGFVKNSVCEWLKIEIT